jgi:outer membrane protein OmpA-like peptidoglycan-associated protein
MKKSRLSLCISFGLLLFGAAAGFAQDVDGAKDHPLVGRYDGSAAVYYKQSDFDEAALLQAPHDYYALFQKGEQADRSGDDWLKLEGSVTQIRYQGPDGRSSLEVYKNFEAALSKKGFKTQYACADSKCLLGTLKDNYLLGQQVDPTNGNSGAYADHARYMLAKFENDQGTTYAAILVSEAGPLITTFVQVVETKAMEGEKVAVTSSDDMRAAIDAKGSIDIYGILFDFDQDSLKPESKETLDQIALLMKGDDKLKLEIVGHTDNKGTADYNLDLSKRRAANVVAALVADYNIAGDRLSASGAGATKPVDSNDSDEGRAKNRRVELVAK